MRRQIDWYPPRRLSRVILRAAIDALAIASFLGFVLVVLAVAHG